MTVTATKAVSITWIQIKAALEELVDVCVESPSASPVGGRAYLITSQTIAAVAAKFGNIALGGRGLSKRGNGGKCPPIYNSNGKYVLRHRSSNPTGGPGHTNKEIVLPSLPEGVDITVAHV